MLRWYGDEDEGFGKCFTDILDMTDAFPDGSPTLMMFIVGPENIERFVKGMYLPPIIYIIHHSSFIIHHSSSPSSS